MYTDDAISPESLDRFIGQANTPQAMKAVAKALEAVFADELVKEMWATTGADKKDFANQTYTSMFNMQLANLWASQGMGLENAIISQLERGKHHVASEDLNNKHAKTNDKIELTAEPEPPVSSSVSNVPAAPSNAAGGGTKVKKASGGQAGIESMIKAAFGGQAANAMEVLYAESSGDPSAVHYNAFSGSTDYGLFQINDRYWAERLEREGIINNVSDLLDPGKNIEAAAWIYRNGGGGWGQWTSVRQGRVQL